MKRKPIDLGFGNPLDLFAPDKEDDSRNWLGRNENAHIEGLHLNIIQKET